MSSDVIKYHLCHQLSSVVISCHLMPSYDIFFWRLQVSNFSGTGHFKIVDRQTDHLSDLYRGSPLKIYLTVSTFLENKRKSIYAILGVKCGIKNNPNIIGGKETQVERKISRLLLLINTSDLL